MSAWLALALAVEAVLVAPVAWRVGRWAYGLTLRLFDR